MKVNTVLKVLLLQKIALLVLFKTKLNLTFAIHVQRDTIVQKKLLISEILNAHLATTALKELHLLLNINALSAHIIHSQRDLLKVIAYLVILVKYA